MAKRQSTDRLLTEAQRAIEGQQPDHARVLLEAAARLDKNDARPWLLLAGIASSARERDAFLAQADRLRANPLPPAPLRATVRPTPNAWQATVSYPLPGRRNRSGNSFSRAGLIVALLVALLAGAYLFAQTPVGEALVESVRGQTAAPSASQQAPGEIAGAPAIAADLDQPSEVPANSPTRTLASRAGSGTEDTFLPVNDAQTGDGASGEQPLLPEKVVAANGQDLATWTVTP